MLFFETRQKITFCTSILKQNWNQYKSYFLINLWNDQVPICKCINIHVIKVEDKCCSINLGTSMWCVVFSAKLYESLRCTSIGQLYIYTYIYVNQSRMSPRSLFMATLCWNGKRPCSVPRLVVGLTPCAWGLQHCALRLCGSWCTTSLAA